MIRHCSLSTVLVAAVLAAPAMAQVTVGPNVQASAAFAGRHHAEVLLAAHPTDGDRLIGCAMALVPETNRWTTVVYASADGGASWSPTLTPEHFHHSGDPACAFGPDGEAYYVDMSSVSATEYYLPVYHSADSGETWSEPVMIPNRFHGVDREYIVVDNTASEFRGRLYLHGSGWMRDLAGDRRAGDITLFQSPDAGRTFLGPVKRGSFEMRYVLGVGNGAVLSDGTFIAVFGELKDYWTGPSSGRVAANEEGRPNALLRVIRSRDGGASLEPSGTVSDFYMDWPPHRTSMIPYLAVDPGSAAFANRAYVVWPDVRGGGLDILLSWSDDGGESWSAPLVVNDDAPPAAGSSRAHMLPVVAANDRGVVGVSWYDRRDATDGLGWTIRFAASLDGGETFLPSVPVSVVNTFDGDEQWPLVASVRRGDGPGPFDVSVSVHSFHFSAGHTAGMAASADGVFHPFWVDHRTGIAQIWTAPVRVDGQVVRNGSESLARLEDASERVELHLGALTVEERGEVSVSARVENTSDQPVRGPLALRLLALRSRVAEVSVAGADNGRESGGAVWRLGGDDLVLEPGDFTEPRILRFRLGEPSPPAADDLPYGLLDLRLRVLAARPAATSTSAKGTP